MKQFRSVSWVFVLLIQFHLSFSGPAFAGMDMSQTGFQTFPELPAEVQEDDEDVVEAPPPIIVTWQPQECVINGIQENELIAPGGLTVRFIDGNQTWTYQANLREDGTFAAALDDQLPVQRVRIEILSGNHAIARFSCTRGRTQIYFRLF